MPLQMLKCINANKIVVLLFLVIFSGCRNKAVTHKEVAVNQQSILGLLAETDTTITYNLGLKKLSEYNFFKQPLNKLIPSSNQVIPYDLNAPLFTDYASKKRFIALPDDAKINYQEQGVLDFPNGTILIKNFFYKKDELTSENQDIILETRLLIKHIETGDWTALPYVWNETQTEAYLYILGRDLEVSIVKDGDSTNQFSFTYSVPNSNMCKNCHVKDQKIVPLGPTARQLNRELNFNLGTYNQLVYLKEHKFLTKLEQLSLIDQLPDYLDSTQPLNERARAYLDVNCAHCHQKGGSAKTSGLHLTYEETDLYRLGLNKPPVAAGQGSGNLSFGIVAGQPDASILLYRMKHLEPGIVMPEIGKNTLHKEGIELIEAWIASLDE